jgi:hypothetical protein
MHYTVWVKFVQGILNAAEKANLKVEALLNAIGLDSSIVQDTDAEFLMKNSMPSGVK